jgi:hypothetical protein
VLQQELEYNWLRCSAPKRLDASKRRAGSIEVQAGVRQLLVERLRMSQQPHATADGRRRCSAALPS